MKKIDLPPQLKTGFLILAFALLGCVNRGMVAPAPDGEAGIGGHGGGPPVDAARDLGGGGIDGGGGGTAGGAGGGTDSCDVVDGGADGGDAGAVVDAGNPGVCLAMFNFESPAGCGLYGAMLGQDFNNPSNTDGFTGIHHTPVASCGRGGLAIDVNFRPPNIAIGGEVIIPVSTTGVDYTGKTLSIAMKGSIAGGANMKFQVLLVTTSRYEPKSISIPILTDWTTVAVTLPTEADASAMAVTRISLQAHGAVDPYVGTIYVDEIDVRNTPPDGGANDVGPTDARADADAAADARDAPSGN